MSSTSFPISFSPLSCCSFSVNGEPEAGSSSRVRGGGVPFLESNESTLYYFYDPKVVSPCTGKYVRVISGLIEPYFNAASPLTLLSMNELFRDCPTKLMELCENAKNLLCEEPNSIGIDVRHNEDLVLVGDIHGQFFDLLYSMLSVQLEKRKQEMRGKRGAVPDEGNNESSVSSISICSMPSTSSPAGTRRTHTQRSSRQLNACHRRRSRHSQQLNRLSSNSVSLQIFHSQSTGAQGEVTPVTLLLSLLHIFPLILGMQKQTNFFFWVITWIEEHTVWRLSCFC